LLPVAVSVNVGPSAMTDAGSIAMSVAIGLLIKNRTLLEVPPPGNGLLTVTMALSAAVRYPVGTVAVNEVVLTNVVVNGVPFQVTTDPEIKFDPVAVSVNAEPGATVDVGSNDVNAGIGFVMVNVKSLEVPPSGVGLLIVMVTVPAAVRCPSGTTAVSEVARIYVVARALPFQLTTDPGMKFEPVRVSVKGLDATKTVFGLIDVRTGTGLVIVNVNPLDVPPPGEGLPAVIVAVPAVVRYPAGTVAVSEVVLTRVVASGVPFQFTTDPETKFEPVTASVRVEDPIRVDVGSIEVKTGAVLVMVNMRGLDIPPPCCGLVTRIVARSALVT